VHLQLYEITRYIVIIVLESASKRLALLQVKGNSDFVCKKVLGNVAIVSSCSVLLLEDDAVPGKASLIYDVELLEIEKGHRPANFFGEIDTDGDNLLSQDEVTQMIFVDFCNNTAV